MINLIASKEGQFEPGVISGPVCWPHHDLLFIHSGRVSLKLNQKYLILTAGEGILIPSGNQFTVYNGIEKTIVTVQYFLSEQLENRITEPILVSDISSSLICETVRFLVAAESSTSDYRKKVLHPLLESIINLIVEKQPLNSEGAIVSLQLLQPALNRMESNPSLAISMEQLAELCGFSQVHFRALFKQAYGIPPGKYLQREMIKKAERLLTQTNQSIKGIASHLGYGDISHFYRFFKKNCRYSPGQFRKIYRFRG